MGYHHVPVGAGLLVESGSFTETQLLGHIDLHVIDEVAVPDRLEQSIGEAECKNVLRRFLAEEVVDAEDLVFIEDLVQPGIQRDRALEIGAERFLHDDARAINQARFSEQAHRRQRRIRRHAEIVEPAALAVEGFFGLDDGGLQRFGAGRHRHVVQVVRKRIPVGLDHLAGGEFGKRLARELAKAIGIQIIEGYADDAASRDESRAHEMKHAGQQSAAGKIAGGAHENHDLRKPRTHTLRYPCHVNVLSIEFSSADSLPSRARCRRRQRLPAASCRRRSRRCSRP